MSKHPKPWFRKGRGWYIQRDGKQIFLGKKRTEANNEYHDVMGEKPTPIIKGTVAQFADCFLDWVKKHRSAVTFEWYRSRLQSFLDRNRSLLVRNLTHKHVEDWIYSFDVSDGTRRNYARAMKCCMLWCEKNKLVHESPLRHLELPAAGVRETVITPDQYATIMAAIKREPFRDLLTFAWESGARAKECLAVEARHYQPENHRLVFPMSEEKMKRTVRVIHLSETAEEIIGRLAKRHPEGRIFRNCDGKPWTTESVNCAFVALQIRMGKRSSKIEVSPKDIEAKIKTLKPNFKRGKEEMPKSAQDLREEAIRKLTNRAAAKLAPKYCLTVFRHSYCHRLLRAGVDALTVANLMGHSGLSMVAKVYGHLSQAQDYLRDALRKAAG